MVGLCLVQVLWKGKKEWVERYMMEFHSRKLLEGWKNPKTNKFGPLWRDLKKIVRVFFAVVVVFVIMYLHSLSLIVVHHCSCSCLVLYYAFHQSVQALDRIAAQTPQLSAWEATLLCGAVLSAVSGPVLLGGHITEFLAPASAAFCAAIGIGAEFTGKVAVADGKEVAAAAMQCAAEAEGLLANAERAKAVCPLCVGVGASAATLALLVPVLLDTLGVSSNLQLVTEIYLLCPLVAVLAAAVASLALQETQSYASRAIGVGNRRFARSGMVGRTWMSTSELIGKKSSGSTERWKTFSLSVLPAPVLGSLIPGALPTKTIVVAALAAAQSAYFLTLAENVLSRGMDAVALKARSAAVCDTYANQGARSSAILPFTSALSSLCAAATAALVELPFVESLAAVNTVPSIMVQIVLVSIFPTMAALLSAAASVSKARCKVDSEAAKQAACTLALQYYDEKDDPILKPLQSVWELIRLSLTYSFRQPLGRLLRRLDIQRWWLERMAPLLRRRNKMTKNDSNSKNFPAVTTAAADVVAA